MADKNTASVRVWMSEALELELHRLAAAEGRGVSDYVRHVLVRHVYGHRAPCCGELEVPKGGDE